MEVLGLLVPSEHGEGLALECRAAYILHELLATQGNDSPGLGSMSKQSAIARDVVVRRMGGIGDGQDLHLVGGEGVVGEVEAIVRRLLDIVQQGIAGHQVADRGHLSSRSAAGGPDRQCLVGRLG